MARLPYLDLTQLRSTSTPLYLHRPITRLHLPFSLSILNSIVYSILPLALSLVLIRVWLHILRVLRSLRVFCFAPCISSELSRDLPAGPEPPSSCAADRNHVFELHQHRSKSTAAYRSYSRAQSIQLRPQSLEVIAIPEPISPTRLPSAPLRDQRRAYYPALQRYSR